MGPRVAIDPAAVSAALITRILRDRKGSLVRSAGTTADEAGNVTAFIEPRVGAVISAPLAEDSELQGIVDGLMGGLSGEGQG